MVCARPLLLSSLPRFIRRIDLDLVKSIDRMVCSCNILKKCVARLKLSTIVPLQEVARGPEIKLRSHIQSDFKPDSSFQMLHASCV